MEKEIIQLNYSHLRNELYVELHDTVNGLFEKYPPAVLGITVQYNVYRPLFDQVVSVLDVIRKSGYTGEIHEVDHLRNRLFRGLDDAVRSALNHFDAAKREAAGRLMIVLDNYGNIAARAIDQETAAIDDLLREFRNGEYSAMVELLALNDWLEHLDMTNRRFKELMMARYDETAQHHSATNMKAARAATDKAFRDLIRQLEALARVNGPEAYEAFFRELNAVMERYRHLLAQQAGARKAKEGI
jgi:ribosomal 50S subunit-associated protein YjgA (DUF615 family)